MYSNQYDFKFNLDELTKMFNVLNEHAFNNELTDLINFDIAKFDRAGSPKGRLLKGFKLDENKHMVLDAPRLLTYYAYQSYDENLYQALSIVAHEMIHELDCIRGPGKTASAANALYDRGYKNITFGVLPAPYDAHGKFFETEMNRVNSLGLDVQKCVILNKGLGMPKDNKFIEETNTMSSDTKDDLEALAKALYDTTVNTEFKRVWVDGDMVYLEIS